jgi:acyl-CoA reductase-like NAD-dependent aldehyde dehydrogenase
MSSSTSTAAIPHWIDNAPFTSQQTTQLRHPNTQADVYLVHVASSSDVDRAISSAQAAFPAWSATPPQERRAILMKAAELLRQRKDQFVESWQSEMDVGEGFAGFNVMTSAGMIEEVASNITTALQGDIPQAADREWSVTRPRSS